MSDLRAGSTHWVRMLNVGVSTVLGWGHWDGLRFLTVLSTLSNCKVVAQELPVYYFWTTVG